jgi:hypothetical protein
MVDRLKESLADLPQPTCVRCRIPMRWFMSKLVRQDPEAAIVHRFVCPGCEGVDEIETEFKPIHVPPDGPAEPGVRRELLDKSLEVALTGARNIQPARHVPPKWKPFCTAF